MSEKVEVEDDNVYKQIGIRSHGKGLFHKELVTGKVLGNKRVFWIKENVFIVNIVFAWEQAVAKTSKNEIGMIASHRFPMYRPLNNLCSVDYILCFFLTKIGKSLLELASPGGAGRNKTLGQSEFKKLKLIIPSLQEQTKIANFLTAVDEKIAQLTQKGELLARYKKGVMQQIFSQQLRFKDDNGQDFPDWKNKTLRDVLSIGSGKDYKHLSNGNIPVYGTGGYMLSVDKYLHDGESVCIGRKGTIDKPTLLTGKFWTVDTLFYTHTFINCLPKFIYATFHTIDWKNYNEASGVPSLSKSTIEKIEISLPSITEQTKIVNFLAALDDKISHIQTQLDAVKQYKQGLLQQLFVSS